jgi:hypothetical protein
MGRRCRVLQARGGVHWTREVYWHVLVETRNKRGHEIQYSSNTEPDLAIPAADQCRYSWRVMLTGLYFEDKGT